MVNTGKSYGFFDSKASAQAIKAEIPTIRNAVLTPSSLEIALRGVREGSKDSRLAAIAKEADKRGIKYVMATEYRGATGEKTADEQAAVLNQLYQSPVYQKGEPFRGEVFFEKGGEYFSRN